MTDLVACLGTGKGTWTGVLQLVKKEEFEKAFLVTGDWVKEKLSAEKKKVCFIFVNPEDTHEVMRDKIIAGLKGKIKGFEVAVNIDSGTGKEHTALITAILKLGLAPRFVIIKDDKITDLTANENYYFES